MNALRRIAAVAATTIACSAGAVSTSTDYTDLWFTASEPGHGLYMVQNGNTIFLAMFVYGGDTLPRWYYASDITPVNGSTTSWSGILARNQGSSFASPWSPAALATFPVGTVTLNFSSAAQATMTFNVDNVPPVTQQITRFGFINESLAGVYAGGLTATSQCATGPATTVAAMDRLTVQHAPPGNPRFIVDYVANGVPATCTFNGTFTPQGKIGAVTGGSWSCSGGSTSTGTFSLAEVTANRNGLSAHFTGQQQGCTLDGYFGGLRDVQ